MGETESARRGAVGHSLVEAGEVEQPSADVGRAGGDASLPVRAGESGPAALARVPSVAERPGHHRVGRTARAPRAAAVTSAARLHVMTRRTRHARLVPGALPETRHAHRRYRTAEINHVRQATNCFNERYD